MSSLEKFVSCQYSKDAGVHAGQANCKNFSRVFAFVLVIRIRNMEEKLTQQWIRLFMEKLMVQISSW